MLSKIAEGDKLKSLFTDRVFQVKEICVNSVILEDVGDQNHRLITELATVLSLYEKVEKDIPTDFLAEKFKSTESF